MNKKTAIVSVMLGILLIGIVSAGLIDYFGRITGEVTVEAPMFYAGKTTEGNYHLWIDFDKFQEENNGSWISISKTNTKTFFTDTLDDMNFYNPDIEMHVRAKLIDGTPPKELRLEFGYFNENPDGNVETIGNCIQEVEITSTEDYETKTILCQGNGIIPHLKGFYYRIIGMGTGGVKININLNSGETKVQVLGIAQ